MDRCSWLDNQGLAHGVLQAIQSIPTDFPGQRDTALNRAINTVQLCCSFSKWQIRESIVTIHVPCPEQRPGNTHRPFLVRDPHTLIGTRSNNTYQFHISSSFNRNLNSAGGSTNMADYIWSSVSAGVYWAVR